VVRVFFGWLVLFTRERRGRRGGGGWGGGGGGGGVHFVTQMLWHCPFPSRTKAQRYSKIKTYGNNFHVNDASHIKVGWHIFQP